MTVLARAAAVLAVAFAVPNVAAQDRQSEWTLFPLPPCPIADVAWPNARTLELAVHDRRGLARQGGARAGCRVPARAEGLLVDVLLDGARDGRLTSQRRTNDRTARVLFEHRDGLAARRAAITLCRGCRSPLVLGGARPGERLRIFVRGYLVRGRQRTDLSTDRLADFTLAERQRVKDCQTVVGPDGELVRIGADCGLDYEGVPTAASVDTQPDSGDSAAVPTGCPYDYFPGSERFAEETRFRFPVEQSTTIAQAPIHYDHETASGSHQLDCEPFAFGVPCYDGHGGTDFMLIGGFWQVDNQDVHVVAAADGVVMSVEDGHFDRCHADMEPLVCDCGSSSIGSLCYQCGLNPNFGAPHCTEGDGPKDYDGLAANSVEICHADGRRSRYLHLLEDSALVASGDHVDCGTRLALVGSSGKSASPHLHFDAYEFGVSRRVDPFTSDPDESFWVAQNLPGLLPDPTCQ